MSKDVLAQLPETDRDYLTSKNYNFEVRESGNRLHLIIRDFVFPDDYAPRNADLMIIIPASYPNSNPDMFWTYPNVKLQNGSWPKRAKHHKEYLGQSWQRWSRHFNGNKWRPGIDGIRTYLGSIKKELAKGR